MIHQHWTEHLPEAGTITNWGDQQTGRLRQIAELKKQIQAIRKEFTAEEKRIKAIVLSEG